HLADIIGINTDGHPACGQSRLGCSRNPGESGDRDSLVPPASPSLGLAAPGLAARRDRLAPASPRRAWPGRPTRARDGVARLVLDDLQNEAAGHRIGLGEPHGDRIAEPVDAAGTPSDQPVLRLLVMVIIAGQAAD